MKKIINEQVQVGDKCETLKGTKSLFMACTSGCFKNFDVARATVNNGIAAIPVKGGKVIATKDGKYLAFMDDYNNNSGTLYISDVPNSFSAATKTTWTCKEINETMNAQAGPDVLNALRGITNHYGGNLIDFGTGMNNPQAVSQGWSLVKLTDVPEFKTYEAAIRTQLEGRTDTIYVWIKGLGRQYQKEKGTAFIKRYTDEGYKEGSPPESEGGCYNPKYRCIDLRKENGSPFKDEKDPYYMHIEVPESDADTLGNLTNAAAAANTAKYSKLLCIELLKQYIKAYDKKINIQQLQLNKIKPSVNACATRHKYPFFQKKIDNLRFTTPIDVLSGKLDYSWDLSRWAQQKENVDNRIKNILRESLSEIKQLKKKSLTEEKVLSKERFTLIFEEYSNKRKNKGKLLDDLINEINNQIKNGYSHKAINEALIDLPWLSGGFQTLKEWVIAKIIDYFVPGGAETEMGKFITKAAANLEVSELFQMIRDCDVMSNWLTESVLEYIIGRFAESKGVSGTLVDVLRNTLMETFNDSRFSEIMKDKINDLVCGGSFLSDINSKIKSGFDSATPAT